MCGGALGAARGGARHGIKAGGAVVCTESGLLSWQTGRPCSLAFLLWDAGRCGAPAHRPAAKPTWRTGSGKGAFSGQLMSGCGAWSHRAPV